MTSSKCPDKKLRFKHIENNFYSFGPIWSHVNRFGAIWSYLELFLLFLFWPKIFYFSYFSFFSYYYFIPSFFYEKKYFDGNFFFVKTCGEKKFWWKRFLVKFLPPWGPNFLNKFCQCNFMDNSDYYFTYLIPHYHNSFY